MTAPEPASWPVRLGPVPPPAAGFSARQETAPGLAGALEQGTTALLVPARAAGGPPEWAAASGKTQLALALAESLWQSGGIDLLLWINASSRAGVLSGLAQAAPVALGAGPASDAESLATRFVSWLGDTRRRWLVIFDDLTDPGDLEGLWPAGPSGRALVTTRAAVHPPGHGGAEFPVGPFSPRESLSYLMGRLTANPDQRLGAIDLVDELGGEPLALAQASAVIASSALTCRDYRDHFLRRRDELAGTAGRLPSAGEVSWTLSVEQADRLARGSPARSLLAFAAVLDPNGAPAAVFTTRAVSEYLAGEAGAAAGPDHIRTALASLERAGLLAVDQAGSLPAVRMGRPVQEAVRAALPAGLLERVSQAAAGALSEAWQREDPPPGYAGALRSCTASLERAAGDALWAAGGCPPLLLRTAQSLDSARLTGPAVARWQDITTTSDRVLGTGHPDTLLAAGQLASAYLAAGRPADAVSWFQWVLAAQSQASGPDHPVTVATQVRLGQALAAAGKPEEAADVLTEAVTVSERVLGAEHLDTLAARDELAAAQRQAERLTDAIRLYRQTLADRERIQGPRDPDTMTTRQQLAAACLADGRVKDAMSHCKRVLADRERVLGADHPDTIAARSDLASASHTAGRMASSITLFVQACADSQRVLGAGHPDTLARSAKLAHVYYAVGRLTDARALLTDTVARCERFLPPGDPLTQAARVSLGNIGGG